MTRLAFYCDDAMIYGLAQNTCDAAGDFTDEETARIRAAEAEWWAVQELIHDRVTGTSTPDTTPRADAEAPGILLNRDEAFTARSCISFREVMGRNPGSTSVLGLAARLDAYLWPTP